MLKSLLYSDVHFHSWDAFSTVDADGENSRLRIVIEQLDRAYCIAEENDITQAFCGGDLFHVRGKVSPTVLNPVLKFYAKWEERGIHTTVISGNHDLESNNSTRLGSMATALESLGVTVVTGSRHIKKGICLIPWIADMDALREVIEANADPEMDLIIHAPLDGVIKGIPAHGLTADYLGGVGYKRVFVGHYHHHQAFADSKWSKRKLSPVYSIGALTHQTWSDVDSLAGFLIVGDEVEHYDSTSPKFIDLPADPKDWEDLVPGNYVRATYQDVTAEEVDAAKTELRAMGAAGVLVNTVVTSSTKGKRSETTASLESLDEVVAKYATERFSEALAKECVDILRTVTI